MSQAVRRAARRAGTSLPGRAAVRAVAQRRRVPRLVADLAPVLPAAGGRRVVVLARAEDLDGLGPWWQVLREDTVLLLLDRPVTAAPPAAVAVETVDTAEQAAAAAGNRFGTADLVIDTRWAAPARAARTWVALSERIRDRGVYLLAPPDSRRGRVRASCLATVAALDGRPGAAFDGRALERPVGTEPDVLGTVLVVDDGAAIVKRRSRFRILADEGIEDALADEGSVRLRILQELPAGTLSTRAPVLSHPASLAVTGLPEQLPWPRMQLRHYEGRISFYGNTLLLAGRSVLPDSHRFYRRATGITALHPLLRTVPGRHDIGTVPGHETPRRPLTGTYYLLDPQITGHFGHIMTEVVPRLWGWDAAKAQFPDLKALARVRRDRTTEPVIERLLTAYGIAREDIVFVDDAVALESVVTATGMWHNFPPHFTHPSLLEVWDRIGERLVDPTAPSWDRIFLTRKPGSYRTCHNQADVEALFREHGFHILHPEAYDLGLQAGIFRTAKVVAGFGGSAMFNLMHARELQQLIVLNQESFTARNEHLYASLLGAKEDWFWSEPDQRTFHSDWTFDFDRNGDPLRALLRSL